MTDGQLVQNDEQISDSWFDLENECSDMTYQWLILKVKEAAVVVIYNYICCQCLSTLNLWVKITLMVRCSPYSIMWSSLLVKCDRSVIFSRYLCFPRQRYQWTIIESCVKHHNPILKMINSNKKCTFLFVCLMKIRCIMYNV